MNLNVKLSKNWGAKQGFSPKSGRGHGPPRSPLRTATVPLSLLCDVRYSTMERLSWEFLSYCYNNITSQGNDNASQNDRKWKFQWRKCRTVLFSQSE